MLNEALATSFLHFNRAESNYKEIIEYSIDSSIFQDNEKIKTIDAFIFRFIKLQDFMGDRLFKQLLIRVGNYKDNMSLIDILDKLEKLEIIENADRWINYRNIRNKLTHEYPDNEDEVIDGIKMAVQHFKEISLILKSIKYYIETNNLIKL